MYKFIDLFAGIGGLRLAFEKHGCECVFSCEWDAKAQETYKANFGETPLGDIRDVPTDVIPDHDILLAGFPCQPFSLAGVSKKNSLGREHGFADETQGTLFFEIARIIKEKKPRAFLLENVKNLVSHDKGRTYRTIRRVLEKELGYKLYASILDAKGLVPQHRERIYMVGFREPLEFEFPELPLRSLGVETILEETVPDKYTLTDKLWKYLQDYANKHREAGNGFGFGLVNLQAPSRTLSARYYKDGSEILIPQEGKNPRRLTPRECARLQGFPDDFKIVVADTAAYKQFGNSVSVPVVERIAACMMDSLIESKRSSDYYRGEFNFENIRDEVIARASQYKKFYCKFLSPNDTGLTGANQSGFYIAKRAWPLLFDEPGIKGMKKERSVSIFWEQLDASTTNMFKWYGSKSEYRITKFGRRFPLFTENHVGDLFILIQINSDDYLGYVLSGEDAEAFLATFAISPVKNSATYGLESEGLDSSLNDLIDEYTLTKSKFPTTAQIADKAREIYFSSFSRHNGGKFIKEATDDILLEWIDIEYSIFKRLEVSLYEDTISSPFENTDALITFANSALNRRKKRAGQSFEHHLAYIFLQWGLSFSNPGRTELKKQPDFIFPGSNEYLDFTFPTEKLTFLGAKTTCKDRWRQILDEANRIGTKYLATMEKGISKDQLRQMQESNVVLVVPKRYHDYYPEEFKDQILSLYEFCEMVFEKQHLLF
ncbi:type II restriction endonuclease [Paenibacillus sp. UASWS1643]|uniref:type II restriction endonuclease n=1 Tax=Paenibacillus sp. UASWS1643 TaxID=2580422 RepID=UPI00123B2B96|nr:type II restriction endonuclease [Paenibacillus sp. UASWS1643]KAA8753963.1 DNA (cytosine-5-)-methyltransferase [Paenibacillus sp. UASWS1643]